MPGKQVKPQQPVRSEPQRLNLLGEMNSGLEVRHLFGNHIVVVPILQDSSIDQTFIWPLDKENES
jgi:hypothetical protein